jgi:hypothetical protein
MIRTIEHHQDQVIQKVFDHRGNLVRYQAGRPGDAASITTCSTLSEARASLGVTITPPQILTKPKSENPQNQKGYSANRR